MEVEAAGYLGRGRVDWMVEGQAVEDPMVLEITGYARMTVKPLIRNVWTLVKERWRTRNRPETA